MSEMAEGRMDVFASTSAGAVKRHPFSILLSLNRNNQVSVAYYNVTNRSFPGMLNVSGPHCQPKYLDLLSGLSKLKELRGSVSANTVETKKSPWGWPEAKMDGDPLGQI
ncbi:MAG: hypothetical protein J3R72DRAFT_490255 [Linnemannia gamsii]|nr:MAG: hypothetical protein J3R72DRAFT_490255 [Linnemannia gamsii]